MLKPEFIPPLIGRFNNKRWDKFNSEKVCNISYGRIQGRAALISHFQNSSLMHEDKRCRPVLFISEGPDAGEPEPFPMGVHVRPRVPGQPGPGSSSDRSPRVSSSGALSTSSLAGSRVNSSTALAAAAASAGSVSSDMAGMAGSSSHGGSGGGLDTAAGAVGGASAVAGVEGGAGGQDAGAV
jgi:protein phosphatase 1 regulatory subunit 42